MAGERISIEHKLRGAILGTSLAVLALACSAFLFYEYITFRKVIVQRLRLRAEIVAAYVSEAMAARQKENGLGILSILGRDPHMLGACLYDLNGNSFIEFFAHSRRVHFPTAPEGDGHQFERGAVAVFQPVMHNGRRMGTLCLKSDLTAMNDRLRVYVVLVAAVLVCAIGLAFQLSKSLQRKIAGPLLQLEETARRISESKDYRLRVEKQSDDEIGSLTGSFNEMLAQIEQRDAFLRERTVELEAQRRHNAWLLQWAGEGIYGLDLDGCVTFMNPAGARLLGYSVEELIGQPMHLKCHHTRADGRPFPRGECPIYAAFRDGSTHHESDDVMWRKDGSAVPVEYTSTPLRDEQGRLVGATVVFRDISERKRAEAEIRKLNTELEHRVVERTQQLEETNKELEAFSYSVSHDLRAPLRHIQGYAQMLARAVDGQLSDKTTRYLGTIIEASREMGQLIDDLLAFSRMGRAEMLKTTVDLDQLVKHSLRALEMAATDRNITWKIAPLPSVVADPAMLRQVWANLIGNAVKYSRPRDPAIIEVGTADGSDGELVFYVRDNGVGFDSQFAHKLFGVFQRLHGAGEFEGTGIGLANVRRIISRHGGRTWAEGKPGAGATFYFTLPTNPLSGPREQNDKS